MLRSKTVRTVSVFAWLGVFFLAFFAPLAPWIAKNLSEIKEVSVLRIVTGEPAGYAPDFSRIYSDEKRIEIETNLTDLSINSSGQTANEDFGRYFGNEKGINNYLKLPYNRTFQKTQNGEFTEIGYVFLALFPLILIFLPGARTWFVAIVVLSTAAYWFYAMFPDTLGHLAAFSDLLKLNTAIVRAFDSLVLPIGYLAIIAGFAIATAAILFGLKSTGNTQTDTDHELLRLLGVFTVIYGFVYLVSSYGVPWYGILLYFCLFSLISIAGSYATGDEASADSREPGIGFYSAIVIAIILSSWIGRTTVSDAISHLANVEYSAYRLGNLAQEETLVAYHPNYFPIVSALNLRDESAAVREILDAPDVRNLNALLVSASITPKDLIGLAQVLASIETSNLREMMPTLSSIAEMALKQEARKARLRVYHAAFSPSQDNQADTPIYRIGTFLSYYIHDNIHRYYEDSLLFNYRSWFDHTDPDTVAWRMRETGFKHLLLDVNASTIDVSPPYELTARFENLLLGLRSEGFRLVSTDNPCLESALRENEQLTPEEYLARAGVSYDSATLLPDGNYQYTSRYSKRLECYAYLVQIVREGRVNSSSEYSYLLPYAGMIERNLATIDSIFESAKNGERNHYQASGAIERLTGLQSGWMALFEIIDQEAAEMSVEILETNNAETATPAAPGENAEASESDSPELR
ncbi:MAG TPA: hypothetical protein PK765_04285 [bacterium]|nr:hypothetical protein [bacterium]